MNLADGKNFGGTDADEASLLLRSFEDHPAYINLLAHEKFCTIGRKGSGKTAIASRLFQNPVSVERTKVFSCDVKHGGDQWQARSMYHLGVKMTGQS